MLLEVAGLRSGFPIDACLTKTESFTSLTLPKLISLENIWAIDGDENAVLVESLNDKESANKYLKDNLGSNEDSLFIDSYLAANLISSFSLNPFSISKNIALLILLLERFIPPPRKKRSAVFINFPSLSNSALLISS